MTGGWRVKANQAIIAMIVVKMVSSWVDPGEDGKVWVCFGQAMKNCIDQLP